MEHKSRSFPYLQTSRHNVFYFRIRVPKALRCVFSCESIRRSLGTRNRREAVRRCGLLLEQVESLFTSAAEGLSVDLSRLSWQTSQQHDAVVINPAPVPVQPVSISPMLSDVLKEYRKSQELDGVSEKTLNDKASVVDLLIRIVGDLPIDQYQRQQAQKFKDTALRLPPRLNQLPDAPLEELIEKAERTITPTTFNNYLKQLTSVFAYAMREGLCEKNPFDGLRVKQKVKVSELRNRFDTDDLRRLFNSNELGSERETKPYRYWLPLLGLYTGARLNELCQLYLDDVVTVDGIDCIHIRALRADQKLKNVTSERIIPIHSKLIELGFLEYVLKQQTEGQERLFSELGLHANHGYASAVSKWFARVRDKLGFKGGEDRKDFHSFRHTVADHLKQLGVSESLIGGVLGHQTGGITLGRYGKDFRAESLKPVIEMLEFQL